MKKAILIIAIGLFTISGLFGQQLSINTMSISPSQDTACVGSSLTLIYSITSTYSSPLTFSGIEYKVEFNNMSSPTIIGTTPPTTVTVPANSTTPNYTVSCTIPAIANGHYNIRVRVYSPISGNYFPYTGMNPNPSIPYQIYVRNPPSTPTITATNTIICPSSSVTISTTGASPYLWSNGATTQSITVTAPDTYYVTESNICGSATSNSITITQQTLPTVSISGATNGCNNVNLNSTSANTTSVIAWNNGFMGSSLTATTTAPYYATATNECGSVNSNTINVTVNPLPVVTVNSATICVGDTVILRATGATSYSWNPGPGGETADTVIRAPNATRSFTVTGTDVNNCQNTAVAHITVNPLPTITVNSASVCAGSTATLTATGATTYTWSTNETTASITPTLTVNTSFTVIGTDANGCISNDNITQIVSNCSTTGINQVSVDKEHVSIYPNPAKDCIYLNDLKSNASIEIFDLSGQSIKHIQNVHSSIDISELAKGMYFLQISSQQKTETLKIIKE